MTGQRQGQCGKHPSLYGNNIGLHDRQTQQGAATMMQAICKIAGHRIDGQGVWHDRLDHRTVCRRCHSELISKEAGWRPFDPGSDGSEARCERPLLCKDPA